MERAISRPNVVLVGAYPLLVGCLSTSRSCPIRCSSVRVGCPLGDANGRVDATVVDRALSHGRLSARASNQERRQKAWRRTRGQCGDNTFAGLANERGTSHQPTAIQ